MMFGIFHVPIKIFFPLLTINVTKNRSLLLVFSIRICISNCLDKNRTKRVSSSALGTRAWKKKEQLIDASRNEVVTYRNYYENCTDVHPVDRSICSKSEDTQLFGRIIYTKGGTTSFR